MSMCMSMCMSTQVFLDEFAVFELQKQAAVQFIKFIGDKDEGITDPEV